MEGFEEKDPLFSTGDPVARKVHLCGGAFGEEALHVLEVEVREVFDPVGFEPLDEDA
jgi:hypothetical protein